jgi:predicted  nucleic acid-binding Zn-ribbon protein
MGESFAHFAPAKKQWRLEKMAPKTDVDLLRQATERNTEKLDKLLSDLPLLYQDRQSYEKRHENLERRVDVLENHVQKINETISNLHNSSMVRVNDMFKEATDKFTDESKALRKEINDLRTSFYGIIICSVLLPLFFLVIAHYVWH